MQRLEQFLGKSLGSGWHCEVRTRPGGKHDYYYFSPCGKEMRSKKAVARFVSAGAPPPCLSRPPASSQRIATR